jgi:hypothetical protein
MDFCDNFSGIKKLFSRMFLVILSLFATTVTGFATEPYKISEQVFDFGFVGIDYRIFHNYVLTNTSRQDITIDSLNVMCDCSSVLFDKNTIKPGDSVLLKLTFDTKDFYGPVNRKFNVFLGLPEKKTLSLFYLAEVGQWRNGLKPNPFAIFMLPTHKQQNIKITNKVFETIKVEVASQHDTFFKVETVKNEAGKDEELELTIFPDKALLKGTYLSNFTLKIITDDVENPAYLTIPVKVARF